MDDGPRSPHSARPDVPGEWSLRLPDWVLPVVADASGPWPTAADRMRFVLSLARRQVDEETGGPFAAAVFEIGSGDLVSVGLNTVVPSGCSSAHAEVMALSLAQKRLGTHDLSAPGMPPTQLVASGEMCAMCLGATAWAGVASVVFSATSADIEQIAGFDEGPRHPDAHLELTRRGIAVEAEFLRDEGRAVLQAYVDAGGEVYNASPRVHGADTES